MTAPWYASVEQLKARLGDMPDGYDDGVLHQALDAASRAIDNLTRRRFYAETATRYLTAMGYETVLVPDLLDLTSVATDDDTDGTYETTWDADVFDLQPDQPPYQQLVIVPWHTSWFSLRRRSIAVTGSWGYSADTPAPITEACLLMAVRLFQRKNAPYGVVGTTSEFGTRFTSLPPIDPDVELLIKPYKRKALVV
jgi:hypothetical protein